MSSTPLFKANKRLAYTKKNARPKGKNTFHPKRINWSYLYLGNAPRTIIKSVIKNIVFIAKFRVSGIKVKGIKSKNGAQPPKKSKVVTDEIKIILLYSARKNNANPIAEYSTLYPDTNSASASGKSNGCLFVSAKAQIKNKKKMGNKGKAYQTVFWLSIIAEKFNVLATTKTAKITEPNEIS